MEKLLLHIKEQSALLPKLSYCIRFVRLIRHHFIQGIAGLQAEAGGNGRMFTYFCQDNHKSESVLVLFRLFPEDERWTLI